MGGYSPSPYASTGSAVSQGARSAGLVNKANRVAAPVENHAKAVRATRYQMRDAAARAVPKHRVSRCGKAPISGVVEVKHGHHGASYGGLTTCGSVWDCPVCAAKISETRRAEVAEAIAAHQAAGGQVWMSAFTVQHSRSQRAEEVKAHVTENWRRVLSHRFFRKWKAQLGGVHYIRALEVTHGANGWHPHLHILWFLPAGVTAEDAEAFGLALFEDWAKTVEKHGGGWCNPSLWRFERAETSSKAGDYVTKWGADAELTKGHMKLAKGGGRSPWQILQGISAGSKADIMLFREFAEAFKGARQLTWSKGLREKYGLRELAADEEAAEGCSDGDEPRVLGLLANHVFKRVLKRGLTLKLLEAVEAAPDWAAVVLFLNKHGIDLNEPPPEDRKSPIPSSGQRPGSVAARGAFRGQGPGPESGHGNP